MRPDTYRNAACSVWGATVILFAVVLRLFLAPAAAAKVLRGAQSILASRTLAEAAFFLENGQALPAPVGTLPPKPEITAQTVSAPQTEPTTVPASEPAPETTAPETTAPAERPAPFTAEEAEAITLRGNCTYGADKTALLLRPMGWADAPGPRVLIVHTHSCESYTPSPGYEYEPAGDYRTLDEAASVIAVGDALAAALEAQGVGVIHDRTLNDYPSYNSSYATAREKILRHLAEQPSICMVIDVHRDAMAEPVREIAEVGGETCAKLMLVIGTDQGGLNHPNWRDNLSCGLKLQALLNRAAPGLAKDISFRKERFNGDLTSGSLIVEVGSTGNLLPEALASMPHLARAVAELLELECGG